MATKGATPEQIAEIRERCERDLHFLCTQFLGYQDWDALHDDLEVLLRKPSRKKALLLPRGHLKSTFCTIAFTIQQILRNPNIRVLIANGVWDMARTFLREIKAQLEGSKLKYLYGDFVSAKWNEDLVIVRQRTKPLKEPTILTTGVEAETTGGHYDCLSPETLIYTSNGYRKACEMRAGMRVLGSDGKFHSVVAVKRKQSEKPFVRLRAHNQADSVVLTEDHQVMTFKEQSFCWVSAGDLKSGDSVVTPRTSGYNGPMSKTNERIKKMMRSPDVWRLIGYWLAEGAHTDRGGRVRLTFGGHEKAYTDDVVGIVKRELGKVASVNLTESNTLLVNFSDIDFRGVLRAFGSHSYNKHLPPFALNNLEHLQRELVKGYFRGDGCTSNNVVSAISVSRDLLTGIQLILARHGVPSYLNKARDEKNGIFVTGNLCNQRTAWVLGSTHPMLKLFLGGDACAWPTRPSRSFFTPDFWVSRLKEVERIEKGSDEVYDIQVSDTNDFYCPGMIVHNCIILDDLTGLQNSQTPEQREKTKRFRRSMVNLLEPGGLLVEIGTRWHLDDTFSVIMEKERKYYDIVVRKVVEDGKIIFPKHFAKKFDPLRKTWEPTTDVTCMDYVKHLRESMPIDEFLAQYENNPISSENQLFKQEMFKYWTKKPEGLYVGMAVDLAISQRTEADYTALVVLGMDKDWNLYVLDYLRGHWTPTEIVNNVFDMQSRWKPYAVGMEVNGFQRTLKTAVEEEMRRRGQYFGVDEIRTGPEKSKESRIKSLEPFYRRMAVHHSAWMKGKEMEVELLTFPKGKHDDIIDAIAMALPFLSPGVGIPQAESQPGTYDYVLKEAQRHNNRYEGFFNYGR